MSKKMKLIPELRFPEFVNEGEWNIEPLGNLSKKLTEKTDDRKFTLMSITSGLGLISQLDKFGREIAGNSYKNYYVIRKGDFAYNKSSTKLFPEGEIAMLENVQQGAVPNSIFTCFRFYEEKIFSTFAKYLFINNHHGKWLKKFIAVGARAHGALQVNIKDLFSMPFPYSALAEQQKIASCLSSLDELITAHSYKLEALKDHKKGLMQNLFPQKGQKVPNYRFPEFEKDGEWEFELLGSKTIKVGSGITPKGGEKNYKSKGRPFVRSQNVGWGCLILDDIAYIDEETHYTFSTTEIEKDDVLLNITGASIGRSVVASEKIKGGNVNQHVCIIRTTNELNPFFLNQLLISRIGQNQIDSFQAGGNRQGLNFGQIRSFSIPQPPDPKEQQKIASCLTSLDELINAQSEKIEQLQQHKKGLMQGLFPKI